MVTYKMNQSTLPYIMPFLHRFTCKTFKCTSLLLFQSLATPPQQITTPYSSPHRHHQPMPLLGRWALILISAMQLVTRAVQKNRKLQPTGIDLAGQGSWCVCGISRFMLDFVIRNSEGEDCAWDHQDEWGESGRSMLGFEYELRGWDGTCFMWSQSGVDAGPRGINNESSAEIPNLGFGIWDSVSGGGEVIQDSHLVSNGDFEPSCLY